MTTAEKLRIEVHKLLNGQEYDKARTILKNELQKFVSKKSIDMHFLAEIAGSLITLGNEAIDEESVKSGLQILQDNRGELIKFGTASSIDYCIGNGIHALYKIAIRNKPYKYPTPEVIKEYLFNSKSAYFRAYKTLNLNKLDGFSYSVLTNLGNELNHSGRMIEALQLFDTVLENSPDFPQAVVSKADCLEWMMRTSDCPITVNLIATIFSLYEKASKQKIVLDEIKASIDAGLKRNAKFLSNQKVDLNKIATEQFQNINEYQNHSEYRKFCIDKFLSLSEHALYCKCNGAKTDNLAIGFNGMVTNDVKLIRLELLLNRIKSEFSFSRLLFYQSKKHTNEDESVHYTNLEDGSLDGIDTERLRTSFRLCFGILDKIAKGICYLFDLEIGGKEKIYFESFWNNKDGSRWQKINSVTNIHLTALYSIASDLDKINGEFGFYKDWRNKLEHNILVLRNDTTDRLGVYEDKTFACFEDEELFTERTLHLLQITRAAIFSFVFCIRKQLISETKKDSLSN